MWCESIFMYWQEKRAYLKFFTIKIENLAFCCESKDNYLSYYVWIIGVEVSQLLHLKHIAGETTTRDKINSRGTCISLSSCPIMFLHSMSDRRRCSSPVSQSLTWPPISTVTTPPVPHSASSASVSEMVDIHVV